MYVYVLDCEFPKPRKTDIVEMYPVQRVSRVTAVNNTVCEHLHAYRHL